MPEPQPQPFTSGKDSAKHTGYIDRFDNRQAAWADETVDDRLEKLFNNGRLEL